jgi:glycosyltransferase involved in cell wall biosynthesis
VVVEDVAAAGASVRIALVSADVLPTPPTGERYGGLERVVWSLARHLARRGHTVTLYALPKSQAPEGVALVEVEHSTDLLTAEGSADLMVADVVHCHDWSLVGWQLAEEHPERVFFQTWHGPYLGARAHWEPPPRNLVLCGISKWHAKLLEAELGAQPGSVEAVYNGIELDDFPVYTGEREPYLAYLNRLGPEKGLHLAIAMAGEVGRQLRVAGTERHIADPDFVMAMLQRMDGKKVVYEGDLGQDAKYELLSKATALLWLPIGFEEPFGLGIVEAMACGTPVIALDRGDVRELVPKDLILAGTTKYDLGSGLGIAYRPSAHDRMRAIAERFSAEVMAVDYETVYETGTGLEGAVRDRDAGGRGLGTIHELGERLEGVASAGGLGPGGAGELDEGVDGAAPTVDRGHVDLK